MANKNDKFLCKPIKLQSLKTLALLNAAVIINNEN